MAWIYLFIAGVFEIAWATGLKFTEGFTKVVPSLWTVAAMAASMWFMALALKIIPIGTGYAIWTGIGAAGTALIGILYFDEPRNAMRLASIAIIIAGMVGLRLTSP